MANCKQGGRESGFAYIWVLALVMILSIGIGAVIEVDATQVRREQEVQLLAIGREFREALLHYYETLSPAGSHEYPEHLDDLVLDARRGPLRRYLRKIYHDPMTGKATWGLQLEAGRIIGVYSLSEKRPIKQDGFEPEETHFKGAASYKEWRFGKF
ncbi:MAG: type II secretion system protein [Azonexus sp.]